MRHMPHALSQNQRRLGGLLLRTRSRMPGAML
jgi:hypothetical protein